MYAVRDTHSHVFPVGDDGGEEELWHVRSGGRSVTHVSQWGMVEERRICVMYAWGTLTHICSQWGMMEERRSSGMYAVGDAQ